MLFFGAGSRNRKPEPEPVAGTGSKLDRLHNTGRDRINGGEGAVASPWTLNRGRKEEGARVPV